MISCLDLQNPGGGISIVLNCMFEAFHYFFIYKNQGLDREYTTNFDIKELSSNPMRSFISQLISECSFSKLLLALNKEEKKERRKERREVGEKGGREGIREQANFPSAAKQN